MAKDISPTLREFLTEWLEWAEAGDEESDDFMPWIGLCMQSEKWFQLKFGVDHCNPLFKSLNMELKSTFISDGLDSNYPFGEEDYDERSEEDTIHQCPKRLAWVRKTLEKDNHNG